MYERFYGMFLFEGFNVGLVTHSDWIISKVIHVVTHLLAFRDGGCAPARAHAPPVERTDSSDESGNKIRTHAY